MVKLLWMSTFERWARCVKEAEAGAAACHDGLRTALQGCPHIICWVVELICGDHCTTAGELYSTQSISKSGVMGITEECNCSKV